jgi:SprT protein
MSKQMQRDVVTFARAALDAKGLTDWRIGFNRRKRAAGLCRYRTKTVEISIYHLADEWSTIRNTILHEIAHAVAGHAAGHGPVWKATAISLGCTGDRCYEMGSAMTSVTYRFKKVCKVHGVVGLAHKRKRVDASCPQCSPVYNPAYAIQCLPNTEGYGIEDINRPSEATIRAVKRANRAARRARRQARQADPFGGMFGLR